jgi:hypothetical protein
MLSVALTSVTLAQSVQLVPANDAEGNPITNALIQYVVADTNSSGEQLHDIYKLELGKTYFYNQSPVFKNPITLVADEPGTTDETKPPKIIITADDQGEVPYEHCITTFADLTVKNIAFTTTSIEGDYSWANAILVQKDSLRIVLENCYFELIGWGMIEAPVNNTVFIMERCNVRNGVPYPDGDEWVPFFLEIDTGTADSIIMRNNTFFNLQGSVVNIEQQNPINTFIFDHNTLVNVVKGFTTAIHAHLNSTITNNIFYNVSTSGEKTAEVLTDEDGVQNGIINVDTLFSNEPTAPDTLVHIMDEADRKLIVKNNAYFYTQGVKDYWARFDSVEAVEWMNSRTKAMFADDVTWPNFIEENNIEIDPGFTNFGGTDLMVSQLNNHRANGTFGFWGWDPDSAQYPDVHWAFLQWPLPEDFSYSANIPTTDGYHAGSLVYYPNELAQYIVTDVQAKDNNSPITFSLEQNYPNPFNPTTSIKFTLPKNGAVNLTVYNAIGQEVMKILDSKILSAGVHQMNIDMTGFTSGIYFYTLKQGSNIQIQKMVLLK